MSLRLAHATQISIHALREESDQHSGVLEQAGIEFQSTLSVRRATPPPDDVILGHAFQSTLSVRRATVFPDYEALADIISIHALREESDAVTRSPASRLTISIHALREESDSGHLRMRGHQGFQSTLSVRRATYNYLMVDNPPMISIHALREESDWPMRANRSASSDFNPRSP